MKIPANLILENLYTIGNEFVYANSYENYQGYYYEINSKFFVGREFNPNAPRLLKLNSKEIDPLRLNPKISTYINLKGERITNNKIPSIPLELTFGLKYLAKQINSNPTRIIFTTKDASDNSKNYPGFAFTSIEFDPEFGFNITDENKKIIPEIDIFLENYSLKG
jgi:hypothetical protein